MTHEPVAREKGGRRRWVDLAKALATIAILALVLRKVPFGELTARLSHLGARDLALLVVLTILQVSVGVVRWWRLLRRLGENVSFAAIYGDVLVGLTYNMFLPTTVGGDVVRALRCSARVEAGHRAWSTSIFERIAGLLAMALSAALGAAVGLSALGALGSGALGTSTPIPWSVRGVVLGVTVALLVVFFAASAPFRLLVKLMEKRLPSAQGVRDDVAGIAADLEGPLAKTSVRIETLAWSVLYQALGIVFVVVGARGLGAPGHELAIVIGVPLVHVLSMIPITIGGMGLREGLFVAILGRLGVDADVALGLAAQWLASSVGFALAGGVVALGRPPGKQASAASPEGKIG